MATYRELQAKTELSCIRTLSRHAPDMKLAEAQSMAAHHGETFAKMMDHSKAIAILSETILGLGANGEIPSELCNQRPSVSWAIKHVQYCHSEWVCGPISDPIETLMKEKDVEQR